jgi:FtsH-binding integral membrane protein
MNATSPFDNTVGAPHDRTAQAVSHRLYLSTAIMLAGVAFAGFASSYWLPMAAGTLALHPAIQVHAGLFFIWTLYFVVQAALVSAGRTAWHRELGLFGIALAALMVFSGILAQIVQTRAQLSGPRPEVARNVAALGLSAMLMFSVFVTSAIATIRRPGLHRRLMVLASFAIIGAAVVRLFRFLPDSTQAQRAVYGAGVVDLLLLAVVLLDRRVTGRVHPVWVAGGAFLIANQALRAAIAQTGPWAQFTTWLAALGG